MRFVSILMFIFPDMPKIASVFEHIDNKDY